VAEKICKPKWKTRKNYQIQDQLAKVQFSSTFNTNNGNQQFEKTKTKIYEFINWSNSQNTNYGKDGDKLFEKLMKTNVMDDLK
jgi:hypothetical protein